MNDPIDIETITLNKNQLKILFEQCLLSCLPITGYSAKKPLERIAEESEAWLKIAMERAESVKRT